MSESTPLARISDRDVITERLASFGKAWGDRDFDRLMSFMTEDCEFRASIGVEPGTTFRGRSEVRRGFELILAHDAPAEVHLGTVFVSGANAAAQWSYVSYDDSGRPVRMIGCDLFEYDGNQIRVKDAYRKVNADIRA